MSKDEDFVVFKEYMKFHVFFPTMDSLHGWGNQNKKVLSCSFIFILTPLYSYWFSFKVFSKKEEDSSLFRA